MLMTVQECEQMLSLLAMRNMLAELAEGDIDASYIQKQSALTMCSNFDFIFGTEKLYYNGLENLIHSKLTSLKKDDMMKPIKDLINTMKSWDDDYDEYR